MATLFGPDERNQRQLGLDGREQLAQRLGRIGLGQQQHPGRVLVGSGHDREGQPAGQQLSQRCPPIGLQAPFEERPGIAQWLETGLPLGLRGRVERLHEGQQPLQIRMLQHARRMPHIHRRHAPGGKQSPMRPHRRLRLGFLRQERRPPCQPHSHHPAQRTHHNPRQQPPQSHSPSRAPAAAVAGRCELPVRWRTTA